MTPPQQPKVDKPISKPSVSAVRVAGDPEGKGWRLGVIGKRTWRVLRGLCELAPEQVVVALHGLHPRELRWTFRVPSEKPSMHIRSSGEKPITLPPPLIRTVLIEPDEDRLTLIWTAELQVPAPPGSKQLDGLQHVVLWNQ